MHSLAGWTFHQRPPTTSVLGTSLVCRGLVLPCSEAGSAQNTEHVINWNNNDRHSSQMLREIFKDETNAVSNSRYAYLVILSKLLCPSWSKLIVDCRLSTNPCSPRPSELCSTSCSISTNMDSRVGSPFIIQHKASGKIICLKLVLSSYGEKKNKNKEYWILKLKLLINSKSHLHKSGLHK